MTELVELMVYVVDVELLVVLAWRQDQGVIKSVNESAGAKLSRHSLGSTQIHPAPRSSPCQRFPEDAAPILVQDSMS